MGPFGEHPPGAGLGTSPTPPSRPRDPSRRLGSLAIPSAGLVLALAGSPLADDDGPELSPPSGMPAPVQAPAAPTPIPAPTPAPSPTPAPVAARPRRAVMAIPGLMGTPAARSTITSTPTTPAIDRPGSPPLDGPIEMPTVSPAARSRSGPLPGPSDRPVVLESTPFDDGASLGLPAPRTAPPARRATSTPIRPEATPSPAQAPARRARFFGLIPGQAPAPRSTRPAPVPDDEPGRSIVDGPLPEPTAEVALKRRIEHQAHLAVGDRARSIDVKLVGKSANVQARGVKLFQKRAVRKALESLPALSGLRTTIDVMD